MSYRCEVCRSVVGPGLPRKIYVIYKVVLGLRQIDREIPTCNECYRYLESGIPIARLTKAHRIGEPLPSGNKSDGNGPSRTIGKKLL